MKRIFLTVSVAATLTFSPRAFALDSFGFSASQRRAAQSDPLMFTIDPASVRVVRLGLLRIADGVQPPTPLQPPNCPAAADLQQVPIPTPAQPGGIDPGTIINIGKDIWQIIQDNRPVACLNQDYATALPSGVSNWDQLAGWNEPEVTLYEYMANNPYGMQVVDLKFGVMRTWGGSYNGVGKYLTAVTTEPLGVDVAWGFKVTMSASVPKQTIINVGSTQAPIAALEHRLNWSIQTVFHEFQGTDVFYLRGDGVFKHKAGPFVEKPSADLSASSKAAVEMLQEPIRW